MPEGNSAKKIENTEQAIERLKEYFRFQGIEGGVVATGRDRKKEGFFSFDVFQPISGVFNVYTNGFVSDPNGELIQYFYEKIYRTIKAG